jgi:hypothetical protein
VGATWHSTNKCLKNFGKVYPPVLSSILSMETLVGKSLDEQSVIEIMNEGFDHLRRTKF